MLQSFGFVVPQAALTYETVSLEVRAMSLLTVRAAAERMGIGYSTLKQWIHQGKIRTTQTAGGHHRLSEAEVDRMLARQTPSARAQPALDGPTGLIVALSGRNRLRGFVEEVRIDGLLGQVRLRIGDQTLTAVITSDAVGELKLRRGDDAMAIIKSTEVMIARGRRDCSEAAKRADDPLDQRSGILGAALFRQLAGDCPISFLNARLNAASDS